jgi:hypothetical protein
MPFLYNDCRNHLSAGKELAIWHYDSKDPWQSAVSCLFTQIYSNIFTSILFFIITLVNKNSQRRTVNVEVNIHAQTLQLQQALRANTRTQL